MFKEHETLSRGRVERLKVKISTARFQCLRTAIPICRNSARSQVPWKKKITSSLLVKLQWNLLSSITLAPRAVLKEKKIFSNWSSALSSLGAAPITHNSSGYNVCVSSIAGQVIVAPSDTSRIRMEIKISSTSIHASSPRFTRVSEISARLFFCVLQHAVTVN